MRSSPRVIPSAITPMIMSTSRRRAAEDIQFRFKRSPWLIEGRTPREVIAANIGLAETAFRSSGSASRRPDSGRRAGSTTGWPTDPTSRRCSGRRAIPGSAASTRAHPIVGTSGKAPDEKVLAGIIAAQRLAQPFAYPSGLVEVPMSPISDVTAFRSGRWPLEAFLQAIEAGVNWAIEHRAVFCFLAHPSCLGVVDPSFRTIDMICDRVACGRGSGRDH